jgi:hypothetical protein
MARKSQTISSMEELMKALPQIFKSANEDPDFGLRFAANPLMAAEEIGFTLTDELKSIATRRVRFSTATYERLQKLEQQVQELAGEQFDIDSGEAVSTVLFKKLRLPHPQELLVKRGKGKERPEVSAAGKPPTGQLGARAKLAAPLDVSIFGHKHIADPLEPLRDAHPIMLPLLEYRQLEASSPRLAPHDLYERIRRGEVKTPVTRLQFHLKPKR